MPHRIDKVSRLIKEELSLILLYKYKDSDIGMVTITNVKLSPDLKIAKVYISVFDKQKREEVISRINDLKGSIRSELAQKIKIRFIPDLHFYIDDTLDYVEKMEDLFKKIHKDDNEKNK